MVDESGSNDRMTPSPRKGDNRPSASASASAAFRQNEGDRPESASLLPQSARRPPTFDGVSVVAVDDATPSKRLRNSNARSSSEGEGGESWAGGALHLTTAVIGVGILGLPRALVDLGWPGGIAFMAVATAVSLYTALLLVELCSEGGEDGGSSSAGAATDARSPPPPETLLPTVNAPNSSSNLNGSTSSGVGRRSSNQDLQSLAESSESRSSRKRGGTTTAAAEGGSSSLSLASSPFSSGGNNRYETYGAIARAILGPRLGGAVASMQLLACAGYESFSPLFLKRSRITLILTIDLLFLSLAFSTKKLNKNRLAVTYCVTGGASLHSITGMLSPAAWSFLFGIIQFPVAVVAPDLERLAGVSAGGALASLLYATAAVVASVRVFVMTKNNGGETAGPISPSEGSSPSPWRVLDASSTMLFAFGGHFVLPEIAASLSSSTTSNSHSRSHSSTFSPMVPAVKASYLAVALSYFSVAAFGAAAFGENVADDVLLSSGAGPSALVAVANAAVCLHVAAGFHVFSQPCYSGFGSCFESWFKRWAGGRGGAVGGGAASFSSSADAKAASSLPKTTVEAAAAAGAASAAADASQPSGLANATTKAMTKASAAARLCYVLLVAAAAAALPFFSVCMSLVGALAFAPATFVLPPAFAFFSRSSSMRRNKRRRAMHGMMALFFGLLSLACSVSAARGLVVALRARLRGLAAV